MNRVSGIFATTALPIFAFCASPGVLNKPSGQDRVCTQDFAGHWRPVDNTGARRLLMVMPDTPTSNHADLTFSFGPMGLVTLRGIRLQCAGNSVMTRYENGSPVGFLFEKSGDELVVISSLGMPAPSTGGISSNALIPAFLPGTRFKRK